MKTFKSYIPSILLVICLIVAAGLVYAFLGARFSSGDTYPAYSSLRADPMGTRALFEALEDSSDLTAARALKPFSLRNASPHTRIYAGLDLRQACDWKPTAIQGWVATGGRLILAFNGDAPGFLPGYKKKNEGKDTDEKEELNQAETDADTDDVTRPDDPPPSEDKAGEDDDDAESAPNGGETGGSPRLMTWQQVLKSLECYPAVSEKNKDIKPSKALLNADLRLPPEVRWRSPLIFKLADEPNSLMIGADAAVPAVEALDSKQEKILAPQASDWRVIYKTFSGACVLERKIGKGEIVVMGESYLLSNEAMRGDRHADFLIWLMGENRHIVFDETHFGVREQGGVGVLLRRYRLQGVLTALALTGILFVWRNSHSLVPSDNEGEAGNARALRINQDGYLTLIQRGVSPKRLPLEWCEAWEHSRPRQSPDDERRISEAREIARSYDPKNPMAVFDKITRVLTDKSTSPQS